MPGTMTEITVTTTDTDAMVIPRNRLFEMHRVEITNRSNTDIRVRGWEEFTDTDGTVHTTAASQVPLFDYNVASLDAIAVDVKKRVINQLTLQAAGTNIAAGTPVEVRIDGEWEV